MMRCRRFLCWVALGSTLACTVMAADTATSAPVYPKQPVHLIVGFPPGTGPDVVARLSGEWLGQQLGQPFVIENRPGASSNVATEVVARAAPDGYSLLQVTPANAINATLYSNLNSMPGIIPAVGVARASFVMVTNPSFPAKTIPELIAFAKANPGKINMGSSSTGTALYVGGALFNIMAGIDVLQVPFRGTPQAITELLAGRLQVVIADISAAEYVKAGKLRALAVTAAARQDALPDVPTVAETLPGYEASTWYGLGAPKSTPPEIVMQINSAMNTILSEPKNQARLAELGYSVLGGAPGDFGKLVADETQKWGKVIRTAGIKPE
jgi:tripartite-type tricarboxylate transporter receptor subunit TctC